MSPEHRIGDIEIIQKRGCKCRRHLLTSSLSFEGDRLALCMQMFPKLTYFFIYKQFTGNMILIQETYE